MEDVAAVILGPAEAEPSDGYDEVCSEVLSAVEKKDAKALKSALGAFFAMKEAEPHTEEE